MRRGLSLVAMAIGCGDVTVPIVVRSTPAVPGDASPASDAGDLASEAGPPASDASPPPSEAGPPASDAGAATDAAGPVDPTLAGYWNFDEGTGVGALDSSGHGNNGTLQGAATWGPGQVGSHCLVLPSAGAFVDIPNAVVDTSQPYSVSAWVQLSVATGNQTIVSIDGNANSAFFFKQHSSGYFTLELRASDDASALVGASAFASAQTAAGTWYYFTGVFDGSTIALYVDGVLNASATWATPWRALGHTVVGRSKFMGLDADFVTGSIDEVRIYSRALSASEVEALYLLR